MKFTERYNKLLEVYALEEILEHLGLEQAELLELLEELGYTIELQEPL